MSQAHKTKSSQHPHHKAMGASIVGFGESKKRREERAAAERHKHSNRVRHEERDSFEHEKAPSEPIQTTSNGISCPASGTKIALREAISELSKKILRLHQKGQFASWADAHRLKPKDQKLLLNASGLLSAGALGNISIFSGKSAEEQLDIVNNLLASLQGNREGKSLHAQPEPVQSTRSVESAARYAGKSSDNYSSPSFMTGKLNEDGFAWKEGSGGQKIPLKQDEIPTSVRSAIGEAVNIYARYEGSVKGTVIFQDEIFSARRNGAKDTGSLHPSAIWQIGRLHDELTSFRLTASEYYSRAGKIIAEEPPLQASKVQSGPLAEGLATQSVSETEEYEVLGLLNGDIKPLARRALEIYDEQGGIGYGREEFAIVMFTTQSIPLEVARAIWDIGDTNYEFGYDGVMANDARTLVTDSIRGLGAGISYLAKQ